MSRWADDEIRELVTLWPMSTPHKSHFACTARARPYAERQKEGLLEGKSAKYPNPRRRRTRAHLPQIRITLPPPQIDDTLAMQSCSILELDQTRCHWPLG